jgi:hypothetical protein
VSIPAFSSQAEADAWLDANGRLQAMRGYRHFGEDGIEHKVGDNCGAMHYEDYRNRVLCGQDFMAGTICSLMAGHSGPDAACCLDCGGDWIDGSCTCNKDEDCLCDALVPCPVHDEEVSNDE